MELPGVTKAIQVHRTLTAEANKGKKRSLTTTTVTTIRKDKAKVAPFDFSKVKLEDWASNLKLKINVDTPVLQRDIWTPQTFAPNLSTRLGDSEDGRQPSTP